jgi:hypothetical protein
MRRFFFAGFAVLFAVLVVCAQQSSLPQRMLTQEQQMLAFMSSYYPRVEAYVQEIGPDSRFVYAPAKDNYFLGRLVLRRGLNAGAFVREPMPDRLFDRLKTAVLPSAYIHTLVFDTTSDPRWYHFEFVRREQLGELFCTVYDVRPVSGSGAGRFLGRIWIDENSGSAVRMKGMHVGDNVHFDAWRAQIKPGFWLPGYVYIEQPLSKSRMLRAQMRLWSFQPVRTVPAVPFPYLVRVRLPKPKPAGAKTVAVSKGHQPRKQITNPALPATAAIATRTAGTQSAAVREDQQTEAASAGPDSLSSQPPPPPAPKPRPEPWVTQAETNLLARVEQAGLLDAPSSADRVLDTVVQNLEITNDLNIAPPVHCRVIATTPLETTNLAHTILISRGLVDVIPDEATLAMVLAHELAHIDLAHRLLALRQPMYRTTDDRRLWRDALTHSQADEAAADQHALELLQHSPYASKLSDAGLFLRALMDRSHNLSHLTGVHLGDSWTVHNGVRMSQLLAFAPAIDPNRSNQIAALPLGSRTELNPWTNQVQLVKMHQVPIFSAADKMPFEITPLRPSYSLEVPGAKPAVTPAARRGAGS